MSRNVRHYVRLAAGMRAYLCTPLNTDPDALIRSQMEHRIDRWLEMVRRGVFEATGSVYRALFEAAGCQYSDLESAVRRDGLEAALTRLRDAGIYLTHDECKGKIPIVRSGRTLASGPLKLANPLVSGWLDSRSSGSHGTGTTSSHNTDQMRHRDAYWAMHFEDLGLRRRVNFAVRPILPSAAGIVSALAYARLGCRLEQWFSMGEMAQSVHYRALTSYLVALARWKGVRVPYPTHLPPDDFSPVAATIAATRRQGEDCAMQEVASSGVRVAAAALDRDGTSAVRCSSSAARR